MSINPQGNRNNRYPRFKPIFNPDDAVDGFMRISLTSPTLTLPGVSHVGSMGLLDRCGTGGIQRLSCGDGPGSGPVSGANDPDEPVSPAGDRAGLSR